MFTIADVFCLSRIVITIPVFVLVLIDDRWSFLLATAFFILAAITDILDGYFARRLRLVSTTGIFLDTTADKIFVSAILLALVQVGIVPGWAVMLILVREFVLTNLRFIAADRGRIIPAGKWGKIKTTITLIALSALLLAKGLGAYRLDLFRLRLVFDSHTLQVNEILLLSASVLLLLAVLWTAISGAEYIIRALPLFQDESKATTPKA